MLILFILAILVGLLTFILFFNRDPKRIPPLEDAVVSPADGRVIEISSGDGWERIVIFMNIFNVHVQRVPYDGKVISVEKITGKNLAAYTTDAKDNYQVITKIDTRLGQMTIKQVTGILARRIKNHLTAGNEVRKGNRLGKITLGSRVELWLKKGAAEWKVEKGARLIAGVTVVAVPDFGVNGPITP